MRLIDLDKIGIRKANRDKFLVPEYADGWNNAIDLINKEPTVKITECNLYGYTVEDLIILAELYKNKGIVLENVAEAFKQGYKTASAEFNEALQKAVKKTMGLEV